jgi:LPXTG-motif cell wall-anchored protein
MRRTILSAAAPACLLVGFTPLSAQADVTPGTPAPPASATATAARVSDQVKVSDSSAKADNSSSEASASVISIDGKPFPPGTESGGGAGGKEAGEGENKGALIDTVDKSPVRVQVAPWKARADGENTKDNKRSSSASAALATVEVPDHANVKLLTSDASAEHTSMQSTGKSTSDAADISVGDMHFVLLHSEVDSNAKGDTYLLGLNGQKIGTQEQVGQLCALDVSGVAAVSCLTASGGTANGITSGAAEVLGVQSPLPFNPASAFATAGTAGTGTEPSILESVAAAVPVEAPRAAAAAPAAPAAQLPRTGAAVAGLAASGLAGLLAGSAMRLLSRRRSKIN